MAQNSSIQWTTHYKSMDKSITNLYTSVPYAGTVKSCHYQYSILPPEPIPSLLCNQGSAAMRQPFSILVPSRKTFVEKDAQKIHKWSTVEVLYGFTQSFSIKQPCFYWFRMTSLQAVLSPPSPKHSLLRQVLMDKSTPQLVPQHSRRGTVPPSIWEVMLFNQRSTTILYTHTCARVPFTRPV